MKPWQYYTNLMLASLCLVSTVVWICFSILGQQKMAAVQQQQNSIRQFQTLQQVTIGVVQQLAQVSSKNGNIRRFLGDHGVNLTSTTTPASNGKTP